MDASNISTARQWTKCQRFLSDSMDRQRGLRNTACVEFEKIKESSNLVPSGWAQLAPPQSQQIAATLDIEIGGCHITVNADTDIYLTHL